MVAKRLKIGRCRAFDATVLEAVTFPLSSDFSRETDEQPFRVLPTQWLLHLLERRLGVETNKLFWNQLWQCAMICRRF